VAQFNDPLLANSVTLGYLRDRDQNNGLLFNYSNSRHRLGLSIDYFYEEEEIFFNNQLIDKKEEHFAALELDYPYWIQGRWQSSVQLGARYEDEVFRDVETSPTASINLSYLEAYPIAYSPYHNFQLEVGYIGYDSGPSLRTNLSKSWNWGFSDKVELGSFIKGSYAEAQGNEFEIEDQAPINLPTDTSITDTFTSYSLSRDIDGLNRVHAVSTGLRLPLTLGFYFSKFPIALRRWAPFVRGQYFNYNFQQQNAPQGQKEFIEYSTGVDFELLFAHRFPFRISIQATDNDIDNRTNFLLLTRSSF